MEEIGYNHHTLIIFCRNNDACGQLLIQYESKVDGFCRLIIQGRSPLNLLIKNNILDGLYPGGFLNMEMLEAKSNKQGSLDDYLAQMDLQGQRGIWKGNRVKLDFVFKRIANFLKPSLHACDIGLGEGYALDKLYETGLRVTGIDISRYAVQYIEEKFSKEGKRINLLAGDISNIDLEEDQFDLVTCFDVLEHVKPDGLAKAIENIKHALKNGGYLIGTLPYREVLDESKVVCPNCNHKFHRYGHHHSFQSIRDIENMLGTEFQLVKYGDVPYCWFKSEILNQLGTALLLALKGSRGKQSGTTIYFIARLKKQ
jgi:2-polyprenyl-3-methyl-5-hydroxy-6-metoxy-1,4-benzoquinol methylase